MTLAAMTLAALALAAMTLATDAAGHGLERRM